MIQWYPDFWEGIGEIFTRHDDLTGLTYGETARANNIALDALKPETSRLVASENFLRVLPGRIQARAFENKMQRKTASID